MTKAPAHILVGVIGGYVLNTCLLSGRFNRDRIRCGHIIKQRGESSMLTYKQEEFAKKIVEGMNQADAYRSTYNAKKMSDNAVYREASLFVAHPKIAQRINELREELSKATIMTAQKRLEWLTGVIQSKDESTGDKLKAVDIMNKMQGEYVTKVEGNLSVAKLEDLI